MSFTPSPPTPRTVPSTTMLFLRLLFFFVSLHRVVFGDLTITTPQGLIDFSNKVKSGTSYSGATVYLGADLDFNSSFSQQFQPIGINSTYSFRGTFDGQGYIIKNLNLKSSSEYVGLFGYLDGASIRSVIFDESCSFSSFCSESNADVGSIIGYCYLCAIENVVNMASVTFTGNEKVLSLKIGGIVARIYSSSTVRNCVNYGSVTYSGTSSSYFEINIGGVIGACVGFSTNSIQNCANYGALTHNGTSAFLYFGGITGISFAGTNKFENCVSAGKVISTAQGREDNYIGGIVGFIYSNAIATSITHCLWTSDVGCDNVYGYKDSSATVTVTNSKLATLNATTMSELNEYAEEKSWDKWFMLHLNGGTINSLPQDTLVVTQKHFPDPVKEGSTFSFWCMDVECAGIYDPETTDIAAITDLYAGWDVYTVTFNFGNGTIKTKNVFYDEKYGTLPAGERAGWTFIGWFTGEDGSGDEITSETTVSIADDHDLYAQWTINNYTLTFIFNNGEIDVVETLNYSDPIYYPGDPVREGYSFDGWSPKADTMPAHNLNITAHWTINNYTLRFVFNNGESGVVKTLKYSDPIGYPGDPVREGYSFNGWSPKPDTMPAHNLNITAHWTINNYTLTFILDNGESDVVRTLNYSDPIYYPGDPVKEGYSFNGWSDNITTMPAHNLNITAQWTKVTEYVEIVFDKKDLSGNEITAIISKYANDDSFTIANIETVNGETKVIVKFTDTSKAEEFVRNINTSSNPKNNHITRVDFTSETRDSMSPLLNPISIIFSLAFF